MDESNGGLNVLLRYMNAASPTNDQRQDWVALRAVAELAYFNGVLQHTKYPILRTAASCGYLRSTDTAAGVSHPLLFLLSEMRPTVLPPAQLRHSLVEDFVANVLHAAHSNNAAVYPNLQCLGRAASTEGRSPASTPPPNPRTKTPPPNPTSSTPPPNPTSSTPPPNPTAPPTTPPPLAPLAHEDEGVHASTTGAVRYPALATLEAASHSQQHRVLLPVLEVFVRTSFNAASSVVARKDDGDIFFGSHRHAILKPQNTAFLFIKPHAFGRFTQRLVESELARCKFHIDRCGVIGTDRIRDDGLIDRHYAAIAHYACRWTAASEQTSPLSVAATDAFRTAFGEDWRACVAAGRVRNAIDSATVYGCGTGAALAAFWGQCPKRTKLAPGLYAGYVPDDKCYILNGFYLANREKFTAPGGFINFYVVSWDDNAPGGMTWKEFRGSFIGPTNPLDAPVGSLRGQILAHWKDLGLSCPPNVSDNGVHASAGPLEGLAERLIWIPKHTVTQDSFGRALIRRGVAAAFIQRLLTNPEVSIVTAPGVAKRGLIFDLLEDAQSSEALEMIAALQAQEIAAGLSTTTHYTSGLSILATSLSLLSPGIKVPSLKVLLDAQATLPPVVDEAKVPPTPPGQPKPPSIANAPPTTASGPLQPMPPSSVRPRPPGRAVSSPYQYDRRNSGGGLEAVFGFTIQHLSSRRFAAMTQGKVPVATAFFGLRALHSAVVSIKRDIAPDPYLRVVTVVWDPSGKNAEHRRALAQLPPIQRLQPPTVPRPPNTQRVDASRSVAVAVTTSSLQLAQSARSRLSTAERIKSRTNKLQEEILELTRRHEERMQAHASNHASPRKLQLGSASPDGAASSPYTVGRSPRKQPPALHPQRPSPSNGKKGPAAAGDATLHVTSERVALSSIVPPRRE